MKMPPTSSNSRILLIGDLHAPYHHPDSLPFLAAMKKKYRPDRVICMGDEADKHKISFHDDDPDLMSAGDELKAAKKFLKQLEKLFPRMDILESNHGSLHYRKALHHGLPSDYMVSYNQLWGVSDKWQWHPEMRIRLPNNGHGKQELYLQHGKASRTRRIAEVEGCNVAQGHYHERFLIDQWCNSGGERRWAMQVGCLVDNRSAAFRYNKLNALTPVIGSGMVVNGEPVLVPLQLKKNGRWTGTLL